MVSDSEYRVVEIQDIDTNRNEPGIVKLDKEVLVIGGSDWKPYMKLTNNTVTSFDLTNNRWI